MVARTLLIPFLTNQLTIGSNSHAITIPINSGEITVRIDLMKSNINHSLKRYVVRSITPIISGDYDLSIPGEYTLSISAKDESGNEAKKDVKLIVEELKLKTTGYYVYKEKDTWHEFGFHKNNKAGYYPWFCPGFGCGGYSETGTYEIKGNRIILTLTQSTGDFGETKKINNTYEFIYVNENELNYDGEIYKWQKSFDGK